MRLSILIGVLALTLAVAGCGGGGEASSSSRDSSTAASEAKAKPTGALETPPSKVVIGDYEAEGPFASISGGKGNEKPSFDPSGQPSPKEIVTRDLEEGSGPAARRGDEVSVYYVGAVHKNGEVQYYGWPPYRPATFQLGFSTFGKGWEKSIEGMKVGGVREAIIPSSFLAKTTPLDYVIVLKALQSAAEGSS